VTGAADSAIRRYHDGTKHHFHRFARSLGYLDWASQPVPFRSFSGAPEILLPRTSTRALVTYDRLFQTAGVASLPVSIDTIGDVLRHALGLSAWKAFRESRPSTLRDAEGRPEPGELVERRWSLRVNPSSGNLHPTEAYVVAGPAPGLSDACGVYHYAADRHSLEERCTFAGDAWRSAFGDSSPPCFFAVTSIHWREAWKYGERAFRYCQHDLGHAVAALRLAGALVGWRMTIAASWSQADIAALTGVDRDLDYVDAEREEPGCLLVATPYGGRDFSRAGRVNGADGRERVAIIDAVRSGDWRGRANQLSEDHVEWTFIDDIARASEDPGRSVAALDVSDDRITQLPDRALDARALLLRRRSALAFDGRSHLDLANFTGMLSRVMPTAGPPWDALWWTPRVHLAIFVHRVEGVDPGLYVLVRDRAANERLRAVLERGFLWERPAGALSSLPFYCLARGDCRRLAARVSCDQEIAGDGFFSLGMLADFDCSLEEFGPSFYRHLYWETGVVGQVLYLEAEAAGARATGIGCFYDDPVHDVLGLRGHSFQSLYHFTVGMPVEDTRLTTEPGYEWEGN